MQPDYEASLAARHNLAVSLARELKGTGVTSNVVAPGAIRVQSVEELLVEIAPRFGWGTGWEAIERGCVRDMVPNDIGLVGRKRWLRRSPISLAATPTMSAAQCCGSMAAPSGRSIKSTSG